MKNTEAIGRQCRAIFNSVLSRFESYLDYYARFPLPGLGERK